MEKTILIYQKPRKKVEKRVDLVDITVGIGIGLLFHPYLFPIGIGLIIIGIMEATYQIYDEKNNNLKG